MIGSPFGEKPGTALGWSSARGGATTMLTLPCHPGFHRRVFWGARKDFLMPRHQTVAHPLTRDEQLPAQQILIRLRSIIIGDKTNYK